MKKRKLNMLVISPSYLPDRRAGGSVIGCHEFVRTVMLNMNIEVTSFDTLGDGVKQRELDGVSIKYLRRWKVFDNFSSHGWHFSPYFVIYLIKQRKNWDIIYFRSIWNFPSLIGFIICSILKINFVICSSGKLTDYALRSSSLKKKFVYLLIRRYVSNASAIHFASFDEYQNLSLRGLRAIPPIILPNPITPSKVAHLKSACHKNVQKMIKFYTVSRLDKIKNIELVINTVKNLPFHAELHIIGEGDAEYVKFLKSLTFQHDDLFFSKNIKFHGFKSREWVDIEMGDGIFIQASFSEGYSNSILEAIVRKSVTCVSDQCNMNSLIEERLLHVFSLTETSLSNLLVKIVENYREYSEEAIAASKKLLIKHDKEKLSRNFHKQLEELI